MARRLPDYRPDVRTVSLSGEAMQWLGPVLAFDVPARLLR